MKTVVIDHHLYKLTDAEARKLEELSSNQYDLEKEKEFNEYCDELYGKYMDKITRVDNIYKTI